MRGLRGILAANATLFALSISACSDSDPLDSVSSATNGGATNASSAGSNGSNGSMSDGGTTETDTEGSTDADPTTGGPVPTREACDYYLDCLAVVSPGELPAAQMGFGPDGTCWDGPPESIAQCIQACVSGLEGLYDANPTEPACYLCDGPEDCAAGKECLAGECRPPNCGDGILDDDEVCDGHLYCESDCSAGGCNPLNGAGCSTGEQCVLVEVSTQCLPAPDDLPGVDEPCVPDAPVACGPSLQCVPSYQSHFCDTEASDFCCLQLCNLDVAGDCPKPLSCQPWTLLDPPQGAYVGVCQFV